MKRYRKTSIYYVAGFLIAIMAGVMIIWFNDLTDVDPILNTRLPYRTLIMYLAYGLNIIIGVIGLIFYFPLRKEKDNFIS
jgi:hypothetical protein